MTLTFCCKHIQNYDGSEPLSKIYYILSSNDVRCCAHTNAPNKQVLLSMRPSKKPGRAARASSHETFFVIWIETQGDHFVGYTKDRGQCLSSGTKEAKGSSLGVL